MSVSKGQNAFKVYKMLESRKKSDKPKVTRRKKSEPVVQQRVPDTCVQEGKWKQHRTENTSFFFKTLAIVYSFLNVTDFKINLSSFLVS